MAKQSAISIGQQNEWEYEMIKRDQGYITHRKQKGSRWVKDKDIYNQFDIEAMNSTEIILIQVKTNCTTPTSEIVKIQAWIRENDAFIPDLVHFELAIKKDATKRMPTRWIIRKFNRQGELYETNQID